MIESNRNPEYYAGCRDAVWQYAYMRDGVYYVGTTGKTFSQALKEINDLDDEAKQRRWEAVALENAFQVEMSEADSKEK